MAAKVPKRKPRFSSRMPARTIVKLGGVAVAVLVMLLPLFFWPSSDQVAGEDGLARTYITVPPLAVVTSVLPDQSTTSEPLAQATDPTIAPTAAITIAAVGDVIIHDSVLESAYDRTKRAYDFTDIFAPVAPYLATADYTVCSLESRLAGGAVGGSDESLRFNAPYSLADSLAGLGVDLVATANNHSADFGWTGVVRTLDRLDRVGIAHVGTARSLGESETPLIVDIQGIKVAFINYTAFVNGDATIGGREEYAINVLQMDRAAEEAAAARERGAEAVVAVLHFGTEYLRTPTALQTRTVEGTAGVEGLLSRGVDVILGSHPHVVQPIVKVVQYADGAREAYAAYSLGNFLSGQRWRYSDSGIIAYVHIEKRDSKTRVTGISYLPVYVQKTSEQAPAYRVLPVLPGLTPQTDKALTVEDKDRMNQVWDELEKLLYRPDEKVVPLEPRDLGL